MGLFISLIARNLTATRSLIDGGDDVLLTMGTLRTCQGNCVGGHVKLETSLYQGTYPLLSSFVNKPNYTEAMRDWWALRGSSAQV